MTTRSDAAAGNAARKPIDWKRLGLVFLSRYGTIVGLLLMVRVLLDHGAQHLLLARQLPQHSQPSLADTRSSPRD